MKVIMRCMQIFLGSDKQKNYIKFSYRMDTEISHEEVLAVSPDRYRKFTKKL